MNNGDVHFNWAVIDAVPLKQGKRYYIVANCRWVTPSENLRNRTMTNMYKGQPTFLHEVAADMGVSTTTLYKLRKEFQNLTLDELTHIPK